MCIIWESLIFHVEWLGIRFLSVLWSLILRYNIFEFIRFIEDGGLLFCLCKDLDTDDIFIFAPFQQGWSSESSFSQFCLWTWDMLALLDNRLIESFLSFPDCCFVLLDSWIEGRWCLAIAIKTMNLLEKVTLWRGFWHLFSSLLETTGGNSPLQVFSFNSPVVLHRTWQWQCLFHPKACQRL